MVPMPVITYTGTVPGADSSTYNLLNSITAGWPGRWAGMFGAHKALVDIKHDQAGTVKVYKNNGDTDANWVQVDQIAITAPASTNGTQFEVLVEAHRHTKIDWVNGGTIQASFVVDIALTGRAAA